MKLNTNYHKKSQEIEKKLHENLIFTYQPLITQLLEFINYNEKITTSKLLELFIWFDGIHAIANPNNISATKSPKEMGTNYIGGAIKECCNYANEVVPVKKYESAGNHIHNLHNIEQITNYVNINEQILYISVNGYIGSNLKLIALEQQLSPNLFTQAKQIDDLINKVEKKLELFSVMSVISSLRNFMFDNAKENGWTEYRWMTCRDNRVRPTHRMMDNKWVPINEAPQLTGYNHVGEDWGCRCWACEYR